MTIDDTQLDKVVLLIQEGQNKFFVDLLSATENDLRVFVSCYALNLSMIDEIVQATYVTAFQNICTYQPRNTFRSWLKGISRNLLRRELEQRSRTQPLAGDVLEHLLATTATRELEADHEPERYTDQLRDCLDQLAPEARRLIQERYYEDRPVAEIADLLERSSNWVAVNLFRVRKHLLACLRSKGVTADRLAEGTSP